MICLQKLFLSSMLMLLLSCSSLANCNYQRAAVIFLHSRIKILYTDSSQTTLSLQLHDCNLLYLLSNSLSLSLSLTIDREFYRKILLVCHQICCLLGQYNFSLFYLITQYNCKQKFAFFKASRGSHNKRKYMGIMST